MFVKFTVSGRFAPKSNICPQKKKKKKKKKWGYMLGVLSSFHNPHLNQSNRIFLFIILHMLLRIMSRRAHSDFAGRPIATMKSVPTTSLVW